MKKKETQPIRRAHIFFSGRVQGVGFRYTTEKIALGIGLVGWVKNTPDNRVEVVCEGADAKIQLLIDGIKQSPLGPHIKKTVCDWERPTGEFKDFRVEFYY